MAQDPAPAPTKASLKAWWNHFTFVQRAKKDPGGAGGVPDLRSKPVSHLVFGKPLRESLKYASVQISTASPSGELYVWGYIPVVVAKCGLYLKENATEVEGTFRVNGSNKRMRDLQAIFETPPRYGKSMDWKTETWTTHDVASVFRRYLTQMPEPVIPTELYHPFRDALAKRPYDQDEVIATYKRLIRSMPQASQYLLLYVLDLLSVFARKSDKNRMDAANLSVIFRPGLLSHPEHELAPQEHALSQQVLEFLIAHQDWFTLDVPRPARNDSVVLGGTPPVGAEDWERTMAVPGVDAAAAAAEANEFGATTTAPGGVYVARRRTMTERNTSDSGAKKFHMTPLVETPPEAEYADGSTGGGGGAALGVTRSRTLPSTRSRAGSLAAAARSGAPTPPVLLTPPIEGLPPPASAPNGGVGRELGERRLLRKPRREREAPAPPQSPPPP